MADGAWLPALPYPALLSLPLTKPLVLTLLHTCVVQAAIKSQSKRTPLNCYLGIGPWSRKSHKDGRFMTWTGWWAVGQPGSDEAATTV